MTFLDRGCNANQSGTVEERPQTTPSVEPIFAPPAAKIGRFLDRIVVEPQKRRVEDPQSVVCAKPNTILAAAKLDFPDRANDKTQNAVVRNAATPQTDFYPSQTSGAANIYRR